jgi:hypothetical protein
MITIHAHNHTLSLIHPHNSYFSLGVKNSKYQFLPPLFLVPSPFFSNPLLSYWSFTSITNLLKLQSLASYPHYPSFPRSKVHRNLYGYSVKNFKKPYSRCSNPPIVLVWPAAEHMSTSLGFLLIILELKHRNQDRTLFFPKMLFLVSKSDKIWTWDPQFSPHFLVSNVPVKHLDHIPLPLTYYIYITPLIIPPLPCRIKTFSDGHKYMLKFSNRII